MRRECASHVSNARVMSHVHIAHTNTNEPCYCVICVRVMSHMYESCLICALHTRIRMSHINASCACESCLICMSHVAYAHCTYEYE